MSEEEETIDDTSVFTLNLVDTNGENDLNLADYLVDTGMAAYDSEDIPRTPDETIDSNQSAEAHSSSHSSSQSSYKTLA